MPQISNGIGMIWIDGGSAYGQSADATKTGTLPLPTDYVTAERFCLHFLGGNKTGVTRDMFIKRYMLAKG